MLKGTSYFSKKSSRDNLDINQESYDFIEDIMDDKGIPTEERENFWREFAIKYINDINFRYRTHGKYILFNFNEYVGVVNSVEEARELYPGKGRELSYIGDDKIDGHAYHIIRHINEGDDRGCYKLNMNIHFQCGYRYNEKYTFDTGCTDTYCFMPLNWDIKNKIFAKIVRDGIPQDVFDELNIKKEERVKINMGGVNSKNKYWRIRLVPPLPVRLENTSEVDLEFILVPRYEYQKEEERLLGTDFMNGNYTFKLSMFNGEYGLKVSDLEYEDC